MQETILVCVSHPMHGQRLISRGATMAAAFHGRGLILNVHPRPYDEMDFNELQTKHLFQSLAEKYGLPLIDRLSGHRPLAEVIAEVSREEKVTQIILGVSARSKIQAFFTESLVNQVLKRNLGSDLHVVQVDRVPWSEPEFDRGQRAHLVALPEGGWRVEFLEHEAEGPGGGQEGTFFRWATTEFADGFFVPGEPGRVKVLPVNDGVITLADWDRAHQ
jgi:two-component system sensor histidine kinase KdpD